MSTENGTEPTVRFTVRPDPRPSSEQIIDILLPYGFDTGEGFHDGARFVMRELSPTRFELVAEEE